MTSVAENNVNTLGLGLDLKSRYQEAERVCFLVLRSFHAHRIHAAFLPILNLRFLVRCNMFGVNIVTKLFSV